MIRPAPAPRAERMAISRRRTVALAPKKLHGHERVKKVGDGAGVELQFRSKFRTGESAIGELREHAGFDGGEQDLGCPE